MSSRRQFITNAGVGLIAVVAGGWCSRADARQKDPTFGFTQVCDMAREVSRRPFREDPNPLPSPLSHVSYDEYRKIRFRPDCAVWRGQSVPFQIQLFHRGFLFPRKVRINLVEAGTVTPLSWRQDWFTYETTEVNPEDLPADLGFAGFRVHYPLNRPDYFDEVIVFLGASYFRAVGAGQVYGASCRALAVDIGLNRKEEFPFFDEFWIVRPAPAARSITILATVNSPSTAGAYEFIVTPGSPTGVSAKAALYRRQAAAKVGLAPITTMFFYGEASSRPADDFRPEVHDSDGLLIANGTGEWLWRPLLNPVKLEINRFTTSNMRGFGLLQRDRRFGHYLDREAHYDQRPSVWVEPTGGWPPGSVELLQLPLSTETAENINAYWVLDKPEIPEEGLRFGYRVLMISGDPPGHPGGKTIATRFVPASSGGRQYLIEFDGAELQRLGPGADVEGIVSVSAGRAEDVVAQKDAER